MIPPSHRHTYTSEQHIPIFPLDPFKIRHHSKAADAGVPWVVGNLVACLLLKRLLQSKVGSAHEKMKTRNRRPGENERVQVTIHTEEVELIQRRPESASIYSVCSTLADM